MRVLTPAACGLFAMVAVALLSGATRVASAQDSPGRDGSSDPLRGGAFELGPVFGAGFLSGASGLDDCFWFGARVGHRFEPLRGYERVQFGFRAGWEGCYTRHAEAGRVDMIYVNVSFLFGVRATETVLLYWGVGGGELLGDHTPGGGTVNPRPTIHVGPGVIRALGKWVLLDLSVFAFIYEDFGLGPDPLARTTFGIAPNLMFAIQI